MIWLNVDSVFAYNNQTIAFQMIQKMHGEYANHN